jgi:hypothetical protein
MRRRAIIVNSVDSHRRYGGRYWKGADRTDSSRASARSPRSSTSSTPRRLGVDQLNVYLMNGDEREQLDRIGSEVIRAFA